MDVVVKIFGVVFNIILFILLSIFFVPAFIIVTYVHDHWSKLLGELFGL